MFLLAAMGDASGDVVDGRGHGLLILYATVAVGFSFYCSVAEAVLLSVTPSYVATLKEQGKKTAARWERLKKHVDRPLAAILSLNTIAHTVGAAGVGAEAAAIWGSTMVGLASAVMTIVILIFSEIIPKTIGAVYWRSLAPLIARSIEVLIWLMIPLVWMSDFLTRMIGGGHRQTVVTREEVSALATLGAKSGQIDWGETHILKNLFRLNALRVRDIMTPRTVMVAFPQELTVGQVFQQRPDLSISRIPIYADSIDNVTGVVLKTDLLLARASGEGDKPLHELKRELRAVPRHASLRQLLEDLLDQREHIALVVDDYGGTDGLVTLEDLIETLLGTEIVDENDTEEDMRAFARRRWEKRVAALGLDISQLSDPRASESE
ncbi:MAG: hemolysin family protein [Pirellulales bacterium]|nr:hemolysin family protein [Pirellulales bacterium]